MKHIIHINNHLILRGVKVKILFKMSCNLKKYLEIISIKDFLNSHNNHNNHNSHNNHNNHNKINK